MKDATKSLRILYFIFFRHKVATDACKYVLFSKVLKYT